MDGRFKYESKNNTSFGKNRVSSGCQIYFNTIQNTNHKEIIDKLDYIKNKNFCLYLTCNSNKLIRK